MSRYVDATSSISGTGCVLCNPEGEFREGSTTALDTIRGVRTLSDELLCAPDVAPIASGHTLVFPRSHQTSFADTCAAGASWTSVVRGIERVAAAVQREAGDVIAFEHGSPTPWRPSVSGKCGSTEHAHIHLVPCSAGITETLVATVAQILDCTPIAISNISELGARPTGYILVRSLSTQSGVILRPSAHGIPSQLVRHTLTGLFYTEPVRAIRASWNDFLFFAPDIAATEWRACHDALAVIGPTLGDLRHVR
jgi:hypothetical protein